MKRHLLREAPFAFGVPCNVRDSSAVAADTIGTVEKPNYPVDIPPDNEWTKQAVVMQVNYALEDATKRLDLPNRESKTALVWFCAILLVIQIVLIPIAALRDIKENPKP